MNALATFDNPETVRYYEVGSYRSDLFITVTPYKSNPGIPIAAHGIRVPFDKLVTRDMGSSKCPHCKTVYAGHEFVCTRDVEYHTPDGAWHDVRGSAFVGEFVQGRRVTRVSKAMCKDSPVWDLQAQFDFQSKFFEFVELIAMVPHEQDLIAKFGGCLPKEVTSYRVALLERRVNDAMFNLSQVAGAINQIAEKINSAGQKLIF